MKREVRRAICMLLMAVMLFSGAPAMTAYAEEETAKGEEEWITITVPEAASATSGNSEADPDAGVQNMGTGSEVKARLASVNVIHVLNHASVEDLLRAVREKIKVSVLVNNTEIQSDDYLLDAQEEFRPGFPGKYLVDVKYSGVTLGTVQVNVVDALVSGASISTEGDLLVNIYVSLSDNILSNPENYAMTFSWASHSTTIPVSQARAVGGEYCFTAAVNAKELADEISYMFAASGSTVVICGGTTSAMRLLEIYRDGYGNEKLNSFARTALDYGTCAQIYFNYNTDHFASAVDNAMLNSVNADTIRKYIDGHNLQAIKKASDNFGGLTIKSASLILNSTTALRIYYTLDEGANVEDYTFEANGPMSSGTADAAYFIQIDNISAKDLDRPYTVTVTQKDGETLTFTYSAMNYLLLVLKNDTTSLEMKSLAQSLFLYNQAANAYSGT